MFAGASPSLTFLFGLLAGALGAALIGALIWVPLAYRAAIEATGAR